MYKINFYVPAEHLEKVKNAMFAMGAGKIGNYEKCCWQVKGQGQFKPSVNSNPFIGEKGKTERIDEYKVEMVCEDKDMKKVINALLETHPYEEPAYDIVKIMTKNDFI